MQNNIFSVVFIGTPQFALPALTALIASPQFEIIAAITQPDRPSGRGRKIAPPPVKVLAIEHDIPVFQPESIKQLSVKKTDGKQQLYSKRCPDLCDFLNARPQTDFIVVAAYGKIIPASFLSFSRYPILNIHPSLLPRWRGAAPIQRALFAGDNETGVSIMEIEEGLDSGPIYLQSRISVQPDDTFGTLHDKLGELGASLLIETMIKIANDEISGIAQSENNITYAEKWEKSDNALNWNDSADVTLRRIRSCCPIPGAFCSLDETPFKIYAAHEVPNSNYPNSTLGVVVESNQEELVIAACANRYISIDEAQLAGKRRMNIVDLLRGHQILVGKQLGNGCT